MNYQDITKVHCIGIGGIGLSAVASILNKKFGLKVSGSDMEFTDLTKDLEKSGIKVTIGHNKNSILNNTDLIIYTSAIPEDNPELKRAKELNIPTITYAQALGLLTKDLNTVAVCGTHGKTTTTAMISKVLIDADKDPTIVIGSKMKELQNRNYRVGKSGVMVVEACEYKRAFLEIFPNIIVITNIEPEHLDYYKDFKDYKKAFKQFVLKLPKDGLVVANNDDKDVMEVVKGCKCKVVKYGLTSGDYQVESKKIVHKDRKRASLDLQQPGIHNLENACGTFAVGKHFKIACKKIEKSLNSFKGTWRRFDERGKYKNMLVIDDYGHHPTEIRATLRGAREKFPNSNICCVFQPHQYSRTKMLLKEFGEAFSDADLVIIPNIYKVRDKNSDVKSVSTEKLVEIISKNHPNVINGKGFNGTKKYLNQHHKEIDVLLVMGAGDIVNFSDELFKS